MPTRHAIAGAKESPAKIYIDIATPNYTSIEGQAHLNTIPKIPFHRLFYCVTFHFPFRSSSKTIEIRGNSLGNTKSTQLQACINSVFGRQLTVKYVGQEINIIFI